MSKSKFFVASFIVLMTAFGLVFSGCESTPDDDPSTTETSTTTTVRTTTTTTKDTTSTDSSQTKSLVDESGTKSQDGTTGNKQGTSDASSKTTDSTSSADSSKTQDSDYSYANKQLLDQVTASRKAAIDAGAKEAFPELFDEVDSVYEDLKSKVEGGSKDNLSAPLQDLNQRYKGLASLAKAGKKKAAIDEQGISSLDSADYEAGSTLLEQLGSKDSVSTSGSDYNKKAALCEAYFDKVSKNAYRQMSTDERTAAYKAKIKADEVKAYVSRKADYDKGVASYRNGELRRSVDPAIAYDSYKSAKETFLKLYDEIIEARTAAQKRIEQAKAVVARSESTAVAADALAPLGDEHVEEIVAEDAKLLEDDDFSSDAEKVTVLENPLEEESSGSSVEAE